MTGIDYQERKPDALLSDFIESFWMLSNTTDEEKPIVIVPDGRIDLSFSFEKPYGLTLLGLESLPGHAVLPPRARMFSVSFKLLAIENLFTEKFPTLHNAVYPLPSGYFGVNASAFENFEQFCKLLSNTFLNKLSLPVDARKKKLLDLVYASHGDISIHQIAESLNWSSRQINRYFNGHFGISLKAYCTILRFRASLQHLKEGKLFPEGNFTDQAHFIKNIKKFAGVTPKELSKNQNDRFIQFSTLKKK